MNKEEEIIALRNRELTSQANIRTLWQNTADYLYPYINITSLYEPGTVRTDTIYDMTPMLDSLDMVSGLKYILIPSGQNFFSIKATKDLSTNDAVQRYLSLATEISHEKIVSSNFVTEFDEVLRSLITFGSAAIFTEWTKEIGLNYRALVIGSYQLLEDCKKNVDGIILTVSYTARQAVQEFGIDKVGKSISEAADDPKKENDLFEFIYLCRPRENINKKLSQNINTNMKYESVIVGVKDKNIIEEGGFEEFPYPTARWMRPANEKDGRGIGTEMLPQIKVLQQMTRDFLECGNKWNNPPREVLDTFEGEVRVFPGANNYVQEMGSIKSLEQGMMGNFPITEKSLERQTDLIHRAFFKNAFSPLEDLTGDRRTTLEIRERIKQSWPKIGPPVTRIWFEQLIKCITRSVLLLIRNGEIPAPPSELQGQDFGIEFVGPFALELRSSQAKAFQEWVGWIGQMEMAFPNSFERPSDYLDMKDAIPRMGRTFGVNNEDMASGEEVAAKQQQRMQEMQAAQAMQAAQMAGETYSKGTKAPEQGSATQKIMEGMGV